MSGKIEISRELAPCPLCGSEAESHGYADSDQLFVQCTDCGCSVEVGSGRFEIWNERSAPVVERQEPVGYANSNDLVSDGYSHSFTVRSEQPANNYIDGGTPVALYTSPPEPVAVAMSFDFEHPFSNEKRTVTLTKRDVFDGMEDFFYDKLGEQICQCESVGETNVVDCNCDEYVHDFEIVAAHLDKVKELNQ
ncbi:MAG: Lar family restriction alleviation protein [Pseudomonas umsongensis]|nr:Lar family restriction alleviation protein [Pseudomonas umsongensis]